jgi:ankyrin
MAKFVVFAKRVDPMEARLRVFCMTDDREDKTLEQQEHFTEVAKSRDVEVLENKIQYLEMAGNLVPVTKSGEQLQFPFKAFKENRLPFSVRVKDQHADTVGRALFMREPKIAKGEPPQQPICILNIVLPEDIIPDQLSILDDSQEIITRVELSHIRKHPDDYNRLGDVRIADISNLLGEDWVKLAPEIGITQGEVESIIEEYPTSTAQQAQSMLKLFQTKKQNDLNILENGLRTIHRDDIVDRCMLQQIITSTTTTTTTVTKRIPGINKRTSLETNGYEETDLIKDSESVEDLHKQEKLVKRRHEHDESKYSAEEKVVESDEDEEEVAKRSVAERREKIQKRLSCERQIAPSTQKKEINEEITEIKRQSLIEDTRAKHEEEIVMQKPVDNSYKSSAVLPETIVKLKTTAHDSSSVDKSDFEKELQDKFHRTLGDVDKFEHKFEEPKTETIVTKTTQVITGTDDLPETVVKTVETTKTTTVIESEPVVTKRTEVITSTYTDEDGYVKEEKKDKKILVTEDFLKMEKDALNKEYVQDILDEARAGAEKIQSKITEVKTSKVEPSEDGVKETITTTTTTTFRTIESINLDNVIEDRDLDDEDENYPQTKIIETGN